MSWKDMQIEELSRRHLSLVPSDFLSVLTSSSFIIIYCRNFNLFVLLLSISYFVPHCSHVLLMTFFVFLTSSVLFICGKIVQYSSSSIRYIYFSMSEYFSSFLKDIFCYLYASSEFCVKSFIISYHITQIVKFSVPAWFWHPAHVTHTLSCLFCWRPCILFSYI